MLRRVFGLLVAACWFGCEQPVSSPPLAAEQASEALRLHRPSWPRIHKRRHPHKFWRDRCEPGERAPSCGWTHFDDGLSGANGRVMFDPRAPGVVYASSGRMVWQSVDGGETWRAQGVVDGGVTRLGIAGDDPNDVLASLFSGLAHSNDAGKTWRRLALNGLPVGMIESAPSQPLRVYASVSGAPLLTSQDGGYSWDASAYNFPRGLTVSVSIDPRDANNLTVAVRALNPEVGQIDDGVLVRSVDGGAKWTTVYSGQGFVTDLQRCAANPDRLLAAFNAGIARSDDNGVTWSLVPGSPAVNYGVAINPRDCDEYYALPGQVGPRRTRDGGATFSEPLVEGLEVTKTGTFPGTLVVDPNDSAHVILATHGGFYASHDAGEHWSAIPAMLNMVVTSLAVSPRDPGRLWLSSWGSGVWTRDSLAAPWQRVTLPRLEVDYSLRIGLDPFAQGRVFVGVDGGMASSPDGLSFERHPDVHGGAFAIAYDPSDPQVAYLGTQVLGIYKTPDGGQTWQLSNGALTPWPTTAGATIDVRALAIDPQATSRVFAGTNGRGIYRSDDAGQSWQQLLAATSMTECLSLVGGSLYACLSGVQRSDDGGATWIDDSAGLTTLSVHNLLFDAPSGTLYVTTSDGVFRKPPGANEWQPFEVECLSGAGAVAIVEDGAGRWLVVGSGGGVRAHKL